jgi:hypothetical protein
MTPASTIFKKSQGSEDDPSRLVGMAKITLLHFQARADVQVMGGRVLVNRIP